GRALRSTVAHDFIHVLIRFRLPVAIYVLDLDRGVVHQDANRQSQPAQGHNVDGFSDGTQHNDGGQDCEGDRGGDDQGASPTTQKNENHKRCQARRNQRFPYNSTDRTADKNGLIGEWSDIELRWNGRLNLRQKPLNPCDDVQG